MKRRPRRGDGRADRPLTARASRLSKEAPLSFPDVIRAPTPLARSASRDGFATPWVAKTLLLAVIVLACAGGMRATDSATTARLIAGAGAEWANLLRAMAALKLLFAAAASVAVLWRLGAPISATRWGGYALGVAAAWAGPGLIWGLAHILLGTLLLHGGLIATVVLVWRDPATRTRLAEIIARRRAAARARECRNVSKCA